MKQPIQNAIVGAMPLFLCFLITLTLCTYRVVGQEQTQVWNKRPRYEQRMDSVLAGVNRDSLKTGYLYDRVFDISAIRNGNPNIGVNKFYFLQTMSEIEGSAESIINKQATQGLFYRVRNILSKYSGTKFLPLGIFDVRMDILSDSALNKGLVTYTPDSLLVSDSARSNTPFTQFRSTAASFLAASDKLSRSKYNIIIPEEGKILLTDASLLYIKLSLSGGVVTMYPKDTLLLDLTNSDTLNVAYSIYLSDGTVSNGSTYFSVSNFVEIPSCLFKRSGPGSPNIILADFQSDLVDLTQLGYVPQQNMRTGPYAYNIGGVTYTGSFADFARVDNSRGLTTMKIWFGDAQAGINNTPPTCSDQILDKPIIFIDGFDVGNKRQGLELYSRELLYKRNNINFNLGEELRKQGYDIIVLDFPDYSVNTQVDYTVQKDHGCGFIEQNALAVVRVIEWVNYQLIDNNSTEQIVLQGTSMGGVISKFALNYMETDNYKNANNGKSHNCRLWISFDAPHLGAEIPMSIQEFLFDFGFVYSNSAKDELYRKLCNPASQQLLVDMFIKHHTVEFPQTAISLDKASYMRTILMQNPLANRSPSASSLRKVSLINGRLNGGQVRINQSNLAPLLPYELAMHGTAYALILGDQDNMGSLYFFSSTGNASIEAEIYIRKIKNRRKSMTNYGYGNCSIDACQGGYFNTYKEVKDEVNAQTGWAGSIITARTRLELNAIIPHSCFVPSKSALSFGGGLNNLCEDLTTRDLVCNNEIPFDAYYYPATWNMEHATLDAYLADRALYEVNNRFSPFSRTGNNLSVTGPEFICLQNSNQYTANLKVPGILSQNFNWTLPNGFSYSNRINQSIRIGSSPFIGEKTITASTLLDMPTGFACPVSGSLKVKFGNPPLSLTPENLSFCVDGGEQIYNLQFPPLSGTPPSWTSADPSCITIVSTNNNGSQLIVRPTDPTRVCTTPLRLTYQTACAVSDQTFDFTARSCRYIGPVCERYAGPGPASVIVSIYNSDASLDLSKAGSMILLLDARGNKVAYGTIGSDAKTIINVEHLKEASYTAVLYASLPPGPSDPLDPVQPGGTCNGKIGNGGKNLLVSPNPLIENVDDNIFGSVVSETNDPGPFTVSLFDQSGATRWHGTDLPSKFVLPATGLDAGTYGVEIESVTGQRWHDSLTVLVKSEPHLTASPNPANDVTTIYLQNIIQGVENMSLKIVDGQAQTRYQQDNISAANPVELPLAALNLQPGIYRVIVQYGKHIYTCSFSKI
jgi:hypothetical protein